MDQHQAQLPTAAVDDVRAQRTVKSTGFSGRRGMNDDYAGERIKDVADKTCFVVAIGSLIVGFLMMGQRNGVSGFVFGFLIMCMGVFAGYVLMMLMYSYGDMVTNSIKQTKILRKLEAQKIADLIRIEQEERERELEALRMEDAPEIDDTEEIEAESLESEQRDKVDVVAAPIRQDQTARIWTASVIKKEVPVKESVQVKNAAPAPEPYKRTGPLRGVLDARDRRIAHFAERSQYGIICPVCGRLQDSNRNRCYSCECKFVFNDELFKNNNGEMPELLKR